MINDWGFTHLKQKQINVINVQNVSNGGALIVTLSLNDFSSSWCNTLLNYVPEFQLNE